MYEEIKCTSIEYSSPSNCGNIVQQSAATNVMHSIPMELMAKNEVNNIVFRITGKIFPNEKFFNSLSPLINFQLVYSFTKF